MLYEHIITLAESFARHIDRKEATISNRIVGHARLFKRLRDGGGCTVETALIAVQWFSDNWPTDLEWPRDIDRPKRSKEAA